MLVGTGKGGTRNHGQSLSNHSATQLGSASSIRVQVEQVEVVVAYGCFMAVTKYQKLDNYKGQIFAFLSRDWEVSRSTVNRWLVVSWVSSPLSHNKSSEMEGLHADLRNFM